MPSPAIDVARPDGDAGTAGKHDAIAIVGAGPQCAHQVILDDNALPSAPCDLAAEQVEILRPIGPCHAEAGLADLLCGAVRLLQRQPYCLFEFGECRRFADCIENVAVAGPAPTTVPSRRASSAMVLVLPPSTPSTRSNAFTPRRPAATPRYRASMGQQALWQVLPVRGGQVVIDGFRFGVGHDQRIGGQCADGIDARA